MQRKRDSHDRTDAASRSDAGFADTSTDTPGRPPAAFVAPPAAATAR
jgi:hypothetical protein